MIDHERKTIGEVLAEAATLAPEAPFLRAPASEGRGVRTYSFAQTLAEVRRYGAAFRAAGYGPGRRVAVLMGSNPEFYLIKLALAHIGASCVPVNPDYRPGETAYLLDDSAAALAVVSQRYDAQMKEGVAAATGAPPVVLFDDLLTDLPPAPDAAGDAFGAESESSLLYTSGTTGRPKGCILTHDYELACGHAYSLAGGVVSFGWGGDVILNPLPSFHVNAGVVTLFGAMLTGNCLVQPERFSASTWWKDIAETEATVFHYLGVVIAVLMADKTAGREQMAKLRFGYGAGVEPALHGAFENRFGVPLVECWGMTEMCRVMSMPEEPRLIDTRAMGRAREGLEIRVVDQNDRDAPVGQAGEMVLRHSATTPRKGFFAGYLNKPEATEDVWRGGWFHTGDTVRQDADGVVYFIDRAKNIIRRAGENIAAAEVENVLFEDPRVTQVACLAVPDEVREEEVMACIVLAPGAAREEATAKALFDRCFARLAYYKPPGYILFVDELPVTGTQKVVKHQIFAEGEDPRGRDGVFDFRALKKRRL